MPFAETAQLLGNIGEFLASIGVLVTLVYLATQVRQVKNQIYRDHLSDSNDMVIRDSERWIKNAELRKMSTEANERLGFVPPESAFISRLKEVELDEDQAVVLWHYGRVWFHEHHKLWRTAPDTERTALFVDEIARSIMGDTLASLYWPDFTKNYGDWASRDMKKYIEAVNKRVIEIKSAQS